MANAAAFLAYCLGLLVLLGVCNVNADTPANCTSVDVIGTWTFRETNRTDVQPKKCSDKGPWVHETTIELVLPNKARDANGNSGFWTTIYNQGFEVVINGRSYFGFSAYEQSNHQVISHCDRTLPGYSHDLSFHHWTCFVGKRTSGPVTKTHIDKFKVHEALLQSNPAPREEHERIVREANEKSGGLWKAEIHEPFVSLTPGEILNLRGGKRSWASRPAQTPPSKYLLQMHKKLPKQFDWRDYDGVVPVRNQGKCGSCYAFSAADMVGSRLRVITNGTVNVTISTQDIVSCSDLSQGCGGGFPYLVAGRYGQIRGLIAEECFPYQGNDSSCPLEKCDRWYTASYQYVGGYYGACNEIAMQVALMKGPLSVSFEVHSDFMHYKNGIYHYNGTTEFHPYFEETNHAVLLVGYGTDKATNQKYWIVKNSWGKNWGENGYFRIRRGNDECAIESLAAEVDPIPW